MTPTKPRWHGRYYGIRDRNAIGLCEPRPWYRGMRYKDGKNYFVHWPIIRPRRKITA